MTEFQPFSPPPAGVLPTINKHNYDMGYCSEIGHETSKQLKDGRFGKRKASPFIALF